MHSSVVMINDAFAFVECSHVGSRRNQLDQTDVELENGYRGQQTGQQSGYRKNKDSGSGMKVTDIQDGKEKLIASTSQEENVFVVIINAKGMVCA